MLLGGYAFNHQGSVLHFQDIFSRWFSAYWIDLFDVKKQTQPPSRDAHSSSGWNVNMIKSEAVSIFSEDMLKILQQRKEKGKVH